MIGSPARVLIKRLFPFEFLEDNGLDYFNGTNDPSRFNQLPQQQQQHLQHQRSQPQQSQNNLHSSDSLSQMYANNLSKFFDFHKNQQQQQQQQQYQQQQQQLFFPDQLNMSNLIDQSRLMEVRRLNSQYMDQQNTQNGMLLLIIIDAHVCIMIFSSTYRFAGLAAT